LLEIEGKSTIEHLINRVKKSKLKDSIVLCTTENPEDDVLCEIATKNGINFFRGSTEDKLDRWLKASKENNVDFFVTADGDDIFCDPELIDMAFVQYETNGADFIQSKEIVCGAFTYGIKVTALEKVCRIKDTSDTEMMWVYFTDTGLFNVEELSDVPKIFLRDDIRMTLDYDADFTFFETVIHHFSNRDYSLRDIITYLDDNPEVIKINFHLQQEWSQNQIKKTKLEVK